MGNDAVGWGNGVVGWGSVVVEQASASGEAQENGVELNIRQTIEQKLNSQHSSYLCHDISKM